MKKLGRFLLGVILFCFLFVATAAVLITLFSEKNETGAVEVLGYQTLVVTSNSMEECSQTDVSKYEIKSIPKNAMVLVQLVPENEAEANLWYRGIKVGDVLTFRYYYAQQITITHRVTKITEKKTGGFIIELEGDNKNSDVDQLKQTIDTSDPTSMNYVIGKVKFTSNIAGLLLSALRSPVGLVLIIMVPCAIIIMMEVLKINNVVVEDKRVKEEHRLQVMDSIRRSVEENEFGDDDW